MGRNIYEMGIAHTLRSEACSQEASDSINGTITANVEFFAAVASFEAAEETTGVVPRTVSHKQLP